MTTYCAGTYLEDQLESILRQSCAPDEIVISDDGSTDGTWSTLERFAEGAKVPIRLVRQPRNRGLFQNIQTAISACRGSIIVLSDQDDVWADGKVEALVSAFQDPVVMLWFSNADLIDELGNSTKTTAWEEVRFSADVQHQVRNGLGLRRLLHGWTVTGATMAVRRDVLQLALPLPSEMDGPNPPYLHDGWIAVLAALRGVVAVEPRTLVQYRQHAAQVTAMSMLHGGGEGATRTGLTRSGELLSERARVKLVADRLRGVGGLRLCRPEAVEYLLDLEAYLDVRTLGRRARGRRRRVAGQFLRGAYGRYAHGARTALFDLL